MGLATFFVFFVLSQGLHLHSAETKNRNQPRCPVSFSCGILGTLRFPFSNFTQPSCGLCQVDCGKLPFPQIQMEEGGRWFDAKSLLPPDVVVVHDQQLESLLINQSCDAFKTIIPSATSSINYTIAPHLNLLRCNHGDSTPDLWQQVYDYFDGQYYNHTGCRGFSVHYKYPNNDTLDSRSPPSDCLVIQLPLSETLYRSGLNVITSQLFSLLGADFSLGSIVSDECLHCHTEGGQCKGDGENKFLCDNIHEGRNKSRGLILVTVIPGVLIIACLAIVFLGYYKKWNYFPCFRQRNTSSDPSSKSDLEGGSIFFGVSVFSYNELEEATNNFSPSYELGDGGFGTVYHGKLGDGREVAVKRLYQHNYKRVEQFMNEIKILTRLRHRNLVSLYGCTSRHSRELLLVYEYIPNGTVADHIHGERAKSGSLTWPVRMNIAIETASALAYLHVSDIIHRDVKTNNILLDDNFCVKVADFGLSRLFPNDVTHVSTAPQGTPGYVDPEYHQCYQLTNKSDVYSFGVVLIELISSMPAIDMSRHSHEINLANLAINRIQRSAFDELIDSSLGFESDDTVKRTTISVAELAFRCLQLEKELRPTMDEVLEALKEIIGEKHNVEKTVEADDSVGVSRSLRPPASPESEEFVLLKNIKLQPPSPNSVADHLWTSGSTTTNASG